MKNFLLLFLSLLIILIYNGCQKELSTSPEDVLLTKNAIIIGSNPEGARIYVNGKNTGQVTPDTVFWVKAGTIQLTLKKELFKDSSVVVNLTENDTVQLFLDYTTNKTMYGKLYLDSNPRGAQVIFNDSLLNQVTPFRIEGLVPGYYKVKYSHSGYWNEEKIVPVKSVVTTYVDQQMVDTSQWINYTTTRCSIPSDYLSCIAIEKNYIKWIGSLDKGLIKFDDQTWTVYNTDNSLIPSNTINSVGVDSFSNIWVCTNDGVAKINNGIWEIFNTSNSGLPDNKVLSVSFDGSKTCFGTLNNGMAIFEGGQWTYYTKSNSPLPSNQVNFVLYNSGNLWACTNNGLAKITGTTWKIINTSNSSNLQGYIPPTGGPIRTFGFPNNNVKTMAVEPTGKIWVGFGMVGEVAGGSAVQRVGNIFWSFKGIPSPEVFSIAADNNNVKWFGSSANGLSKNENYIWTHYNTTTSKIASDRIFGVCIDFQGHKFLASFGGGLIKYKGN